MCFSFSRNRISDEPFNSVFLSCRIGNCKSEWIVIPCILNAAIQVVAVRQHDSFSNVDIVCMRYDLPVPAVPYNIIISNVLGVVSLFKVCV